MADGNDPHPDLQAQAAPGPADSSARRYRLLAEHMGDVVTLIRMDGSSSYVSAGVRQLLGYRPREMAGRPVQSFVHQQDRHLVMAAIAELAAGTPRVTLQHRAIRKDGGFVWVETSFQRVPEREDRSPKVVAVIRDISQRKRLELALAESEQRYRSLAEASPDILIRFGPDGLVRYCSPSVRILGLDPEAVVGRPVLEVVEPDHLEHSVAILESLFGGADVDPAVSREHCVLDKAGQRIWLEGRPSQVRDAEGRVIEVVTVLRDITARRAIKAALAESEARYRRLANTAPDIITECSLDGTLAYVSPAVVTLTGRRPEDMVGQSALSLMEPRDAEAWAAMCQAVYASNGAIEPWPIQFPVRHTDGHQVWLESKPAYFADPATGELVGLTDILRDITAHKALESSLLKARAEAEAAAAVKGEFLANMSHELRTPLTAVLGFSRLVAEQPELSDTTRGYVQRLTTAGKALLSTVNDILDFSKLEAGQVEIHRAPVRPAEIIADTVALFEAAAGDKGIAVAAHGLESLPDCLSLDPDRLRQVLLNLIGNAVKFTSVGQVSVRADWDAAAQVLTCQVSDTGPGIAPDQLTRLFQRFAQVDASSTRRHGGTGLGLAICKGLVEAMGGRIAAASHSGEGSRFEFTLPAPAVRAPADPRHGPALGVVPSGSRVLVADDNPVNRELVRAILATCEIEVTEAADGAQAVALAQSMPFDLILMDLRMPVLDGAGATRAIRAAPGPNAGVPIVGFSADTSLAAGDLFDAVLGKPIQPERLISLVTALLGEQQPGEAGHAAA